MAKQPEIVTLYTVRLLRESGVAWVAEMCSARAHKHKTRLTFLPQEPRSTAFGFGTYVNPYDFPQNPDDAVLKCRRGLTLREEALEDELKRVREKLAAVDAMCAARNNVETNERQTGENE